MTAAKVSTQPVPITPPLLPAYQVRTHNASAHSENRMHSDDVAAAYGFKGALVPGVTVFSHMTQPLVAHYGVEWLARGDADVSFAKPAYEGDLLTVRATPAAGADSYALTCINEPGVELAQMSARLHDSTPAVDERAARAPAAAREKDLVTWDLMEVGVPFPALAWSPTQADNLEWCADVRDELPLYREGDAPVLHPGFILRQANLVLRNRFLLPAWIHTASRIMFHAVARAGEAFEVRAIPEEKWRRKGHEFVRLYVCILRGASVVAEIAHTAIFQPRKAA
jgi:acyl dehydratase